MQRNSTTKQTDYGPMIQRALAADAKRKREDDIRWLSELFDALPPHGTEADYLTDDPEAA